MKVVLFCGGQGLRIRDLSDKIPKPLVSIGQRPILWHIMRYYAHHGHRDFILCLGYKSEAIKRYFIDHNAYLTHDFVLSSGQAPELLGGDIQDWRITFVDTGLHANVGQRLKQVERHLGDDPYFLANYSDTLTDAPLNNWIERFKREDAVGSFMCVRPHLSLHTVYMGENNRVRDIRGISSDILVNGGYFTFRRDIFDHIGPGEELVEEPFQRLIRQGALLGQRYTGFWATMDTYKDHQHLEALVTDEAAPWEVWKHRDTAVV